MRLATALIFAAIFVQAQNEQPTDFQGWANRGIQLFKQTKYQEAIDALERAAALRPDDARIHLYPGTVHMQLWIPGLQSPENAAIASHAAVEYKRVLEINPYDTRALASLTSLSFNATAIGSPDALEKMDEARDWNHRWRMVDPRDKDAYYWAGVIVWREFYPALTTVRIAAGLKPEDPGPLPASSMKLDLAADYGPRVDEGIMRLRQAIEIDPQYADAMAYLNLLIRERADLRDSNAEYKRDIDEADGWIQRSIDVKKQAQAKVIPPDAGILLPPPPPSHQGNPVQAAERIRVDGNVQQTNLIHKVDPVWTPLAAQARIGGTLRFSVIVGKDGKLHNIQVVSGHPLLVPAAFDALKQWEYMPTVLNNAPVEVISQIELNMRCGVQ